jgi:hypothetical protein
MSPLSKVAHHTLERAHYRYGDSEAGLNSVGFEQIPFRSGFAISPPLSHP